MAKNLLIAALALALGASIIFHLLNIDAKEVIDRPSAEPASSEATPSIISGNEPAPDVQPEPAPAPDPRIAVISAILDEATQDPGLAGAAIGFCLLDPGGEVIVGRNEGVAQVPASSLKTLTTATALEVLGPDYRFTTRLGVSKPDEQGRADLIILGGGDPMLSPADYDGWVRKLVEAGMANLPGRVIGDGRRFTGSLFADFWNWGDIGNGYGSPVSGLNLGHNRFFAVFAPGEKEGDPANFISAFPEVPGVKWWNETLTGAEGSGDGVVIHGGERTSVMHLRGTVPLGGELQVKGAVPDPERFAAHHLREMLVAVGIEVAGEARGAGELYLAGEPIPAIEKELLVHPSPPLLAIVASIHDTSDNHETECVYRTLGLEAALPPEEVIRRHWEQRGLDLSALRLVDGSGLGRAGYISPHALARLQHLAATGPAGEAYVGSLLKTAGDRLHFKAGAMSAVRSYTGLIDTPKGRLSFALMLNHYPDGAAVNRLQQAVFDALLEEQP